MLYENKNRFTGNATKNTSDGFKRREVFDQSVSHSV